MRSISVRIVESIESYKCDFCYNNSAQMITKSSNTQSTEIDKYNKPAGWLLVVSETNVIYHFDTANCLLKYLESKTK